MAHSIISFVGTPTGYRFKVTNGNEIFDQTRSAADFQWLFPALQHELCSDMIPALPSKEADPIYPATLIFQFFLRYWFSVVIANTKITQSVVMRSFLALPLQEFQDTKQSLAPLSESSTVKMLNKIRSVVNKLQKPKVPASPSLRDVAMSTVRKNQGTSKYCATSFKQLATLVTNQLQQQLKRTSGSVVSPEAYRQRAGKTSLGLSRMAFGDRVEDKGGNQGTVMSVGMPVDGKGAPLLGICWDDPTIGDCDGGHNREKHFHCAPHQGSFVKGNELFWPASEEDVVFYLCRAISEIDHLLFQPTTKQQFIESSCRLHCVLITLSNIHQALLTAYDPLIAAHEELRVGEAWLHVERQQKREVVTRELEMEDILKNLDIEWNECFDGIDVSRASLRPALLALQNETAVLMADVQSNMDILCWAEKDVISFKEMIDVVNESTFAVVLEAARVDG